MADAREYGGIVAAERSAWEMWNEIDFVLRSDNPLAQAVKVKVNGLLELSHVIGSGLAVPDGMSARVAEGIAEFERQHPELVAEVRRQREKRRFHWSGLSRTAVVAPGENERLVYKLLSWETHPDILATRDVDSEIRDGDATLHLAVTVDVNAAVERSASSTSECLLRAWNVFAQFWMLKEITDIPPRKPA